MAAATHGKIGELDPGKQEWAQYVEQLGHFFTVSNIDGREEAHRVLS